MYRNFDGEISTNYTCPWPCFCNISFFLYIFLFLRQNWMKNLFKFSWRGSTALPLSLSIMIGNIWLREAVSQGLSDWLSEWQQLVSRMTYESLLSPTACNLVCCGDGKIDRRQFRNLDQPGERRKASQTPFCKEKGILNCCDLTPCFLVCFSKMGFRGHNLKTHSSSHVLVFKSNVVCHILYTSSRRIGTPCR